MAKIKTFPIIDGSDQWSRTIQNTNPNEKVDQLHYKEISRDQISFSMITFQRSIFTLHNFNSN